MRVYRPYLEKELVAAKLYSQCKGYPNASGVPFCGVACISINDEVVHGVPSKHKVIQEGDLVKVDICASSNGYCADMARCYFVGTGPNAQVARELVDAAQQGLDRGIAQAVIGNRIGDISSAVQRAVEQRGFQVVRMFAGHGIGKKMHEDPEILNYGQPGKGPLIEEGMAFAIEPMITQGSYQLTIDSDGWTARTRDNKLAAHIEDTIIVTENGPEITTRL